MAYKKVCFLTITCLFIGNNGALFGKPEIPTAHNFIPKQLINKTEQASLENKSLQQDNNLRDNVSYIFRVKYPDSIKKQPSLRAYYKGYKYDISNMGIISDQTEASTLFLVITDQIKHNYENERIQYLERIENNPCRAFFLSSNATDPNNIEWFIHEENIQNIPLRLPEDALVILFDANLVDNLQKNANKFVEDLKKNLEFNPNNKRTILYLPELIIKKDIKQSQIDLVATYASLRGIDLDAIHVSPKKEVKIERERIVELTPFGQHLAG